MALQDLEDLGMRDSGEAAVGEDGANSFAVGSRATLQRMDDGKRSLAFAKIRGYRLAEHIFCSGEIENVVDNLKGEAEVAAILAKLRFKLFGIAKVTRRRDGGAELHGDLEETCCLA